MSPSHLSSGNELEHTLARASMDLVARDFCSLKPGWGVILRARGFLHAVLHRHRLMLYRTAWKPSGMGLGPLFAGLL